MRKRRTLDTGRIAEAVKAKGIDLRHWSSHATVGTVSDDGTFDPTDPHAVVVAPDGQWCDVMLQPLNVPLTARVQLGVGGRSCVIMAPIRPGDEVLVVVPDGELSNPMAIVAVLNSQAHKIPIGADHKPVFRNDRLSIFAADVPIEIRTASGAIARMEVAGDISVTPAAGRTVMLGGTADLERAALGDTIQSRLNDIEHKFNAHSHPVPGVTLGSGATTSSAPTVQLDPTPTVTSSNVKVKK